MRLHAGVLFFSMLGCAAAFDAGAAETTVFASGLDGPTKLTATPAGNLLVTERGTGNTDGRLTRIDRYGIKQVLVSGLPSGIETTGVPAGPGAIQLMGGYVLVMTITESDTLRFSPSGPPVQVPNPVGPNSPINSSVLRLVFSASVDALAGGFTLTGADLQTLTDGYPAHLANASGERLTVYLVEDLKDFRPDPRTNVRGSNPWGMSLGRYFDGPLIADSGQNTLVQLQLIGPPKTLVRFPPIANPPGSGPPFSDAVPTNVRHYSGDKYLVSLLSGVPFRPGNASVQLVDIGARTATPFITGLNSVTDVLPVGTAIYVLEISTNLSVGAPGRLLKYATPGSAPEVVAAPIIGGTNLVYIKHQNAIYITENFTGLVKKVAL